MATKVTHDAPVTVHRGDLESLIYLRTVLRHARQLAKAVGDPSSHFTIAMDDLDRLIRRCEEQL